MSNIIGVKEAAELLGVSTKTIRRWEAEGKIKSVRTEGGHRRFEISQLLGTKTDDALSPKNLGRLNKNEYPTTPTDQQDEACPNFSRVRPRASLTIGYARVSSYEQKQDLERQVIVLETYCAKHGWCFEIIQDLGSGLNYRKKGLIRLIKLICSYQVERLVVTHKDRLLRFGSELIFTICEIFGVEVIVMNRNASFLNGGNPRTELAPEDSTFEEDLAQDVLEIITVFSARLYGSRSHKNKQIVKQLKEVANNLK